MASVKIAIPFWKDGDPATGEKGAWHIATVNATYDTSAKVPEGMPMVKSSAVGKVPPERLQPDPTP